MSLTERWPFFIFSGGMATETTMGQSVKTMLGSEACPSHLSSAASMRILDISCRVSRLEDACCCMRSSRLWSTLARISAVAGRSLLTRTALRFEGGGGGDRVRRGPRPVVIGVEIVAVNQSMGRLFIYPRCRTRKSDQKVFGRRVGVRSFQDQRSADRKVGCRQSAVLPRFLSTTPRSRY